MKFGYRIVCLAMLAALMNGCSGGNAEQPSAPSGEPSAAAPAAGSSPEPNAGEEEAGHSPAASAETANARFDPSDLAAGAFAFADEAGSKLLVDSLLAEPEGEGNQGAVDRYNIAVGNGGELLHVSFDSEQQAGESNNGRQNVYNFGQLPGLLYTVEHGTAQPDATYFVAEEGALTEEMLLNIVPAADTTVPSQMAGELENRMGRPLLNLYPLDEIEGEGILYLVQFAEDGDDYLAALVLGSDEGLVVKAYPAKLEYNSAWRVDDGGEVVPDMFSLLFAARTESGFVMGLKWLGAEGETLSFLERQGNEFVELDISYGRYMAPI